MTPLLPKHILLSKAPPIKIQGIKTKLLPFISESIAWDGKGTWIEPFMGSCVVALNVAPKRAILADTNEHLIRFYQGVQSGEITPEVAKNFLEIEGAKLLERGEEHYYEVRARFNLEKSPLDLLFLNRACFNGIMRFNKKGGFNVPFCRKPERYRQALITKICNQIALIAKVMRGKDWVFSCQSWQTTLKQAKPKDFVYLDPPYIGRHTDYYNQWKDSEANELTAAIKALSCGFAYSMWKGNKYRENEHLEESFGGFHVETISHFYHVGASENLRNAMEEALVISPGHVARVAPKEARPDDLTQGEFSFSDH
jgi:DNA adenine methylase